MDKSVIKRLATQCGIYNGDKDARLDQIEAFANAIAAHERNICADIAANQRDGEDITEAWKHCSRFIEQRIRARD